jgi:hypothetical protein
MENIKYSAQYHIYSEGQYIKITDKETDLDWRIGLRDHSLVNDIELTKLGFNGTENTDWCCIKTDVLKVIGAHVREGIRDTFYVVDIELTKKGFSGTENTDWINVKKL